MNNKMIIRMTIFIVLFLLLAAAVVYLITGTGKSPSAGPEYNAISPFSSFGGLSSLQDSLNQTAPAVQTYDPVPVATIPPTPVPTPVSTPFFTPAPTPVPTLPPTPAPTIPTVPAGTVIGNGTFRSETGTLMDIRADWTAIVENDVSVSINVSVYAEHYQLTCVSGRTLNISLGDNLCTLQIPEIHYDLPGKIETLMGTNSFSIPLSTGQYCSYPLAVEWYFGGEYSNTQLPVLACSGTIAIQR